MSDTIKINVLRDYRGVRSNNVLMKAGLHGVKADFAKYLVDNGHAEYVDEPKKADTDVSDDENESKPKRKTRKKSTSKKSSE